MGVAAILHGVAVLVQEMGRIPVQGLVEDLVPWGTAGQDHTLPPQTLPVSLQRPKHPASGSDTFQQIEDIQMNPHKVREMPISEPGTTVDILNMLSVNDQEWDRIGR